MNTLINTLGFSLIRIDIANVYLLDPILLPIDCQKMILLHLLIFNRQVRIILLLLLFFQSAVDAQSFQIGQGNIAGVTVTTSSQSTNSGISTIDENFFLPNHNKASRFLSQATLGYNYEEIENVLSMGIEDWLDEQMNLPIQKTLDVAVREYHQYVRDSLFAKNGTLPQTVGASIRYFDYAWWQYHMTQDDLLRQRIALALSEIIVISTKSGFGDEPYAFGSYYDIFLRHAFGNYRDILQEVTYHPAMGSYLTFLANPKSNPANNVFPDENYSREIMQLFTIGLDSLNIDGSPVLIETSTPEGPVYSKIPTYNNEYIAEFSKIFTGLMFGDRPLQSNQFRTNALNDTSWAVPMQMFNDLHEPGIKTLFRGEEIGSTTTVDGDQDISDALDNLFNHPNVGPFVSKLLIQRLVTSNPTPAYISRVAQIFNNNGQGEKGDLAAVVKAILLDDEALSCESAEVVSFGMLREPFIRYIHMMRAFDLSTNSGKHRNAMYYVYEDIDQKPLASPSVFNFFQPDYQPIGDLEQAELVAPEFQITNSQSIMGYLNGLNQWMVRDDPTDEWNLFNGEANKPDENAFYDLSDEIALAADNDKLHILVDRLNMLLAHGSLSPSTSQLIIDALTEFPIEDSGDIEERARIAIHLVMSCPEYLINR